MTKVNTDEVYEWQLTKTTVSQRIKHLYNNSLMADVHFVVADKRGSDHPKVKIPCHKFVLAVSSPVFFAMFYGELPELSESIDLPDCDSEGLLEFLRYIYCDEVQLTGSCVMQVLYLAKKYMIPSLADHCRSRPFLEASINADNVLDLLPVVDKLQEAHLIGVCWYVIDYNAEEILQSASVSLLENRNELLLASILRRDSFEVNEVKIFQAVNCWANDICAKRGLKPSGTVKRKVIGERILRLIRFPLIPQKEFAEHVPDSGILTETEVYQMFMYYNLSRKPKYFSCNPRRRIHRCKRFDRPGCHQCYWYYNHCLVDSISFEVDISVLLGGVRLFGFEGETYFVKLKVCGETLIEDKFQTEAESKDGCYGFDIIFQQCRLLTPGEICVLEALIKGPKSLGGVGGKEKIVCGKVTFHFSTSKASNGSSAEQGQFSDILFTYP